MATVNEEIKLKFTAEELFKRIDEREKEREKKMPDERAALEQMFEAYQRMKDLGWKEAIYCPKDGTYFDAIEAGSTGIFKCRYHGEWPNGSWFAEDGGDLWPARPILFRREVNK